MITPLERLIIAAGLDLMTVWGSAEERVSAVELLAKLEDKLPCEECIGRADNPDRWCDCRKGEECPGPCRQRAHETGDHD